MKPKTMLLMVALVFVFAAMVLFTTGCKSTDTKPQEPNCYSHQMLVDGKCVDKPILVDPTPVPTATPPPAFVPGEHCSSEGKQFYCGNPRWYGYPKCSASPTEDGDIFFKDYQALVDMMAAKDRGLCLTVYTGGVLIRVPNPWGAPGPCASCAETGVVPMMKSFFAGPKKVEICKEINGEKSCTFSFVE